MSAKITKNSKKNVLKYSSFGFFDDDLTQFIWPWPWSETRNTRPPVSNPIM
jgi:hypothetical protein